MEQKVKQQVKIGEVTREMLRAGLESNETPHSHPARFQADEDGRIIAYSVRFDDAWEEIERIGFDDLAEYMAADTYDETVWLTPNWSAS